jgi:hypothetical protein
LSKFPFLYRYNDPSSMFSASQSDCGQSAPYR